MVTQKTHLGIVELLREFPSEAREPDPGPDSYKDS